MYQLLLCSNYSMIALNITIFESRAATTGSREKEIHTDEEASGQSAGSSFSFRHDPWRHVVRILQQSLHAMVVKAHPGPAGYTIPCSLYKNHKMQ